MSAESARFADSFSHISMINQKKRKTPQEYTKLPISVSLKNFRLYIDRNLSRGKRGPKPKIARHRVFNCILQVLRTGMQWDALHIGRNELHWTNVYKWHLRWSKDGSYEKLFRPSVQHLKDTEQLDLSVLHGDGSNTIAKKGVRILDTQVTNIKKA